MEKVIEIRDKFHAQICKDFMIDFKKKQGRLIFNINVASSSLSPKRARGTTLGCGGEEAGRREAGVGRGLNAERSATSKTMRYGPLE